MEDLNDPRHSAHRPQSPDTRRWRMAGARGARWRMPVPPWGDPPDLTGAEREREARAKARAAALGARLHLTGLVSTTGVIVMCVVLAAVIIMLTWVLTGR